MEREQFDQYLRETQEYAQQIPSNPHIRKELIRLIDQSKGLENVQEAEWQEFFKGEFAFYSGQYEKALKHYVAAKSIPNYHYFCFRASAFVAKNRNNLEQTNSFAQNALKLYPEDCSLKRLLEDSSFDANNQKISIGEKEIAELANIFEEHQEEELFSQEFALAGASANSHHSTVSSRQRHSHSTEVPMSSSDSFPSSSTYDSPQASLTERLYALAKEEAYKSKNTPHANFTESASQTYYPDLNSESELESKIQNYQQNQSHLLQQYLEASKRRANTGLDEITVVDGWSLSETESQTHPWFKQFSERFRKHQSGLYLRWNGKGIVINPGQGFLRIFHQMGHFIQDIDFVIVTRDQPEAYNDVKEIYELNHQLIAAGKDIQIIQYYLNQKAHRELAPIIKPNFKQARNTVHNLEIFLDSPEVEKVELADGITLNYFLATPASSIYKQTRIQDERRSSQQTTLGIRLDLKGQNDKTTTRIGYISGAGWSPLLAHHLGQCDILMTGFGNTSQGDFAKANYLEECLGYHGTYSLIEEISPRLCLITDFGGKEGDIRLEVARKLRHELGEARSHSRSVPVILPANTGLQLELNQMQIKCSVTHQWIDAQRVKVAKTCHTNGGILYLSPSCCL